LKINGSYPLPVTPERAYELLQDPEVLAQCMPGTERLVKIGSDEYEMKMKMVISAVQGLFAGKVRIADQKPPEQFRLIVEGSGKVGFMRGDGLLTLSSASATTEVHYEGEVHVGGVIAGVGQRLLDTTAKIVIRKFFEKLTASVGQATQVVAAPLSPPPPENSPADSN
jgi:carbon monoxide dehydrogenase subunit G